MNSSFFATSLCSCFDDRIDQKRVLNWSLNLSQLLTHRQLKTCLATVLSYLIQSLNQSVWLWVSNRISSTANQVNWEIYGISIVQKLPMLMVRRCGELRIPHSVLVSWACSLWVFQYPCTKHAFCFHQYWICSTQIALLGQWTVLEIKDEPTQKTLDIPRIMCTFRDVDLPYSSNILRSIVEPDSSGPI